jgi:hypothetical protein
MEEFDDLPLWFKTLWIVASGVSIGLALVVIWAIIQVVSYVIG